MRFAKMLQAVDAHACGEPGRVIVGGVLDVPGDTMFDKMCHLQTHGDDLRKRVGSSQTPGQDRAHAHPRSPAIRNRISSYFLSYAVFKGHEYPTLPCTPGGGKPVDNRSMDG